MMMTMLLMIFLPVGFYSLEINYYILLIKENNRDFLQVEFSDISRLFLGNNRIFQELN